MLDGSIRQLLLDDVGKGVRFSNVDDAIAVIVQYPATGESILQLSALPTLVGKGQTHIFLGSLAPFRIRSIGSNSAQFKPLQSNTSVSNK